MEVEALYRGGGGGSEERKWSSEFLKFDQR